MGIFKGPKPPKPVPPATPVREDSSEVKAAGDRQRRAIAEGSYGVDDTILSRKKKEGATSGMGTKTILG